ncbi:restriction endonuclease subunit S [Roseomonas sp. TAS13]|uniref:restriction endonuclease subunit S n=1 Tax=Roseomonas sp. TAS13 TaxID=1926319 RepID=UPI0015C55A02|nr:restriction endonuclease subunit S [Roseomonas sp. TAS13]
MTEWQTVPLGTLASSEPGAIAIGPFGSRMKAELYVSDGVPVIRGTNISAGRSWKGNWVYVPEEFAAEMPNCLVRSGDLVFPHRGSIGEVALVPPDGRTYMISTSLMKFRADVTRALPEFLFYRFKSYEGREEILRFGSQVGTPGIGQPLTSLRQFRVNLPPIDQQRAIASVLGALDDKIDLNRRMNETLEAMARAIFKDWFVDFGPTRAKMEGRPPYLAPDLWALFPDRLDDEGKPEGWKDGDLGSFVTLIRTAISPSQFPDEVFEHHSLPAYDAGQRPVTEAGSKILSNKTIVPQGAVLLSKLNPEIVRVWLADVGSERKAVASTEFLVLQPSSSDLRDFIYCCVSETGFRRRMEAMVSGTSKSHQRVSPSAVLGLSLVLPPTEVMTVFGRIAGPLLDQVLGNRREAVSLGETRDLLLPKLMSGEIRVREAENLLGAVA